MYRVYERLRDEDKSDNREMNLAAPKNVAFLLFHRQKSGVKSKINPIVNQQRNSKLAYQQILRPIVEQRLRVGVQTRVQDYCE